MTAPYDRPSYGEPGGCDCHTCGRVFVGAEWHTECAVCALARIEARSDATPKSGAAEGESRNSSKTSRENGNG